MREVMAHADPDTQELGLKAFKKVMLHQVDADAEIDVMEVDGSADPGAKKDGKKKKGGCVIA